MNYTIFIYFSRNIFGSTVVTYSPSSDLPMPVGMQAQVTWTAIQPSKSHPLPIFDPGQVSVSGDSNDIKKTVITKSNLSQIGANVDSSQVMKGDVHVKFFATYGENGKQFQVDTTIRNKGTSNFNLLMKQIRAFVVGLVIGVASMLVGGWMHG